MFSLSMASFAMFERKVMLETQTILQFFYKVLMWHGPHYLFKKIIEGYCIFIYQNDICIFFSRYETNLSILITTSFNFQNFQTKTSTFFHMSKRESFTFQNF